MEIKYLQKLQSNQVIGISKIQGVSETEIGKSEKEIGAYFPQAYKEYLYLAGKFMGGLDSQLMPDRYSLDELTEDYPILQRHLKKINVPIDRPMWAFTEMEGYTQFWFFYLDEGDNPPVWGKAYEDDPTIDSYIYPIADSFSEFVDELIDSAIRYSKLGY